MIHLGNASIIVVKAKQYIAAGLHLTFGTTYNDAREAALPCHISGTIAAVNHPASRYWRRGIPNPVVYDLDPSSTPESSR